MNGDFYKEESAQKQVSLLTRTNRAENRDPSGGNVTWACHKNYQYKPSAHFLSHGDHAPKRNSNRLETKPGLLASTNAMILFTPKLAANREKTVPGHISNLGGPMVLAF